MFSPSHVMAHGSSPPDLPNNMAAVTAANAARTRSAHQANACQVQVTLITGIIYTAETRGGKVALHRAVEAQFHPLVPSMPFPPLIALSFSVLKRMR